MFNETIKLFLKISKPDKINLILFFNACSRIGTKETLTLAKEVLSNLPNYHHKSLMILTAAFDAFIKCGDLSSAEKLFPKIERTVKSYGNLMKAYNKNDQLEKTLDLWKLMEIDGIQSDELIFVFLFNACANIGTSSISESIYEQMPKSFLQHPYIQTALIDMWVKIFIYRFICFLFEKIFQGKSGCIHKAKSIFESIVEPNTVGYTTMS
jgi:pentatricopeptide repeat protein